MVDFPPAPTLYCCAEKRFSHIFQGMREGKVIERERERNTLELKRKHFCTPTNKQTTTTRQRKSKKENDFAGAERMQASAICENSNMCELRTTTSPSTCSITNIRKRNVLLLSSLSIFLFFSFYFFRFVSFSLSLLVRMPHTRNKINAT